MGNLDFDTAQISAARQVIDPVFLDTPQYEDPLLNDALGRRVVLKVETCNPIRSFKGRGVSVALSTATGVDTVVCASSGNFGQAVAYVGRARGMAVRAFAPASINPVKRARMEAFGATITLAADYGEAREAVRSAAEAPGTLLLEDGVPPAIAVGAGTMAAELDAVGPLDAVVVPIGDGSLISGIGCWVREHRPGMRVVGVNPEAAPAMYESFRAGRPVRVDASDTFAEGISVPVPHAASLERVRELVDDIVLVKTEEIAAAMDLAAQHVGIRLEPAGAASLAAIAHGRVAGDRVASILTGANPR
jgi:threonine dehydratase